MTSDGWQTVSLTRTCKPPAQPRNAAPALLVATEAIAASARRDDVKYTHLAERQVVAHYPCLTEAAAWPLKA